jgi:hypothetical protein
MRTHIQNTLQKVDTSSSSLNTFTIWAIEEKRTQKAQRKADIVQRISSAVFCLKNSAA